MSAMDLLHIETESLINSFQAKSKLFLVELPSADCHWTSLIISQSAGI